MKIPLKKKLRTGETEGLSDEANFLRHLHNLGHEDVESSALEIGGRWEKAAKEWQAHEVKKQKFGKKEMPKTCVKLIDDFVWGRCWKDQVKHEVAQDEIMKGLDRLNGRISVGTWTREKFTILANKKVTPFYAGTRDEAIKILSHELLEDQTSLEPLILCPRHRWKMFCAWTKGGTDPGSYPFEVRAKVYGSDWHWPDDYEDLIAEANYEAGGI